MRQIKIICCFVLVLSFSSIDHASAQYDLTAIDILLDPGQVMLDSAKAYNDLMRNNYTGPGSFALDATHTPHITVLQCFVKTAELGKVYAAVARLVKHEKPTKEKPTASGFYYIPLNGLGLAGITVKPTPLMLSFQAKLIAALKPFMWQGTNAAFVQNVNGTPIAAGTAEYVNAFISDHSGSKYNPHVTIGLAQESFLKELLARPFATFTFNNVSVSIYHLGDFGTAQKKLWTNASE